jgi:hypothetical protein
MNDVYKILPREWIEERLLESLGEYAEAQRKADWERQLITDLQAELDRRNAEGIR